MSKQLIYRPEASADDGTAMAEQLDYLEGALWADKAHRLDMDVERNVSVEIDAYGTCTKAFWRGVLETAGSITISGGRNKYPAIALKGSYHFLKKLVDFLNEELSIVRHGEQSMVWDGEGKLAFQCSGGQVRITGQQAHAVCRLLYIGQEVGRESIRQIVDQIIAEGGV